MKQEMTDRNGNTINVNGKALLDTFEGRQPGLFKGLVNDTLAYFKPKCKYDISGYGTTITVLKHYLTKAIGTGKESSWILTDDDCLQYQKQVDWEKYEMVQAILLDEGVEEGEGSFFVGSALIDLEAYPKEDQESAIIPYYGYSLDSLADEYGPTGAKKIIAECIFEDLSEMDYTGHGTFHAFEDAREAIERYIGETDENNIKV